jgi:magnesium transporter
VNDPQRPRSGRPSEKGVREPHPGSPPGTELVGAGPPPEIVVIDYTEQNLVERKVARPDDVERYLASERQSITWVDVRGISDQPSFERLGEIFRIHPLALEDIVNVPQRPHTDAYPEHHLLITRMVETTDAGALVTEQLAILLGVGYVLTVQEEPERDCLEPVRERLRQGRGGIRSAGADYLAYALLDAVIDGFFPVLEHLGERLEELELEVTTASGGRAKQIHDLKRELLTVRRAIWPQRDLINALLRDDSPHISKETRLYLRDTYDHAVLVMDMVETFREIASGLMDLYLSAVSTRMNEIMKVLTIISTIFLPLTFIAGIYGMNFDSGSSPYNMPELHWRYGYPFALALMLTSAVVLVYSYRRKGWIGGERSPRRRDRRA